MIWTPENEFLRTPFWRGKRHDGRERVASSLKHFGWLPRVRKLRGALADNRKRRECRYADKPFCRSCGGDLRKRGGFAGYPCCCISPCSIISCKDTGSYYASISEIEVTIADLPASACDVNNCTDFNSVYLTSFSARNFSLDSKWCEWSHVLSPTLCSGYNNVSCTIFYVTSTNINVLRVLLSGPSPIGHIRWETSSSSGKANCDDITNASYSLISAGNADCSWASATVTTAPVL